MRHGACVMRVILLGPPGAGKGTHAVDLSKQFFWAHISTGEILREAVKQGTPTGVKAKSFMDKGELVPDAVVVGIVAERLKKPDCAEGFVLDGFPRNLAQARELDATLKTMGGGIDRVLNLQTDTAVIIRRLTGRRMCKNCNAGYNVFTLPPKKEGVCDACGGPLIQREDDKEATILNRLGVYDRETKDLIEYYRDKGLLQNADGNLEKEQAFGQIVRLLQSPLKAAAR